MTVYDAARLNMIDNQLRPNKVTDERVLDAFMRLRREVFVPERLRGVAYLDDDLPLGDGRYLITPMVAARLLQAADIEPKDTALVVGAGVGYEAWSITESPRSFTSRRRWPSGTASARPTTSSCSPAQSRRYRRKSAASLPKAGAWRWFCGHRWASAAPR